MCLFSPQVEDGEVHASLDQLGSRVSFTESPENYDNLHMVANMDKQLSVCVALEQKLSSFEKEMAADPRYIHRVTTHIIAMWRVNGTPKLCSVDQRFVHLLRDPLKDPFL